MAKKPEPAEVSVIDEREVLTYPRIGETAYTLIVTYRHGDQLPRTIFIPLSDVAKGREEQLRSQMAQKKGDLYNTYLEHRRKKIREDMEKAGAFKPETVRI